MDVRGPAFKTWDRRALLVQIVQGGLAEAVCFAAGGSPVPPSEVLYKKAAVLAPGYFEHTDSAHEKIHEGLLSSAIQQFHREFGETASDPRGFFCLPATAFVSGQGVPEPPELLSRVDALHSHGGDVLLFHEPELYAMTAFVNRYTKEPVRFVVGLSLLMRAFEDRYRKLDGSFLEALSRLFAQNVRIYAHPMMSKDLQEAMQSLAATGWEWKETNGWVSAPQLRLPAPLAHLYNYLLESNFLVSMPVPAVLTADA